MKSKIPFILFLICLTAWQLPLYGQGYSKAYYSVSTGLGTTADYIAKSSWRGVGLEFGSHITPNITLGLGTTINVFYENVGDETFTTEDNITISGKQYRNINVVPIFVTAQYQFKQDNNPLKPYVGLGIGTNYVRQETDLGLYAIINEGWQFGLFPEVGLDYALMPGVGLVANIRYNYGAKTPDTNSTSFINLNVGFAFSLDGL